MADIKDNKEITVVDLYNDFLCDIDVQLDTALTLLNILDEDHFEWSEKKIQEDKLEQYQYLNSYKDIQTMIFSIREFMFQASKEMKEVMNIRVADIVPIVTQQECA